MTDSAFEILDNALRISLWTFLLMSAGWLAYLAIRSRLSEGRSGQSGDEEGDDEEVEPARLSATGSDLGSVYRSLTVCLLASIFLFVFLIFAPISFIDNFSNSRSWTLTPLRLTQLTMQRLDKGFVLEGEVYNQTEQPMEGISAAVRILGIDRQLLEEIAAPLDPAAVAPGQAASFKVRYREEPANLFGYEMAFRRADGTAIAHTEGFDVHAKDDESR